MQILLNSARSAIMPKALFQKDVLASQRLRTFAESGREEDVLAKFQRVEGSGSAKGVMMRILTHLVQQ
jgi:hypothetical protein